MILNKRLKNELAVEFPRVGATHACACGIGITTTQRQCLRCLAGGSKREPTEPAADPNKPPTGD